MKIQKVCAALANLILLTSSAQERMINFEGDTIGFKSNNFSSVSESNVRFTDTNGTDLYVGDFSEAVGQGLAVFNDDASRLLINFGRAAGSLSLTFGNDDACCSTAGDRAWLQLFNGLTSVGLVSVEMNRDDLPNQVISASGVAFDSALFWYGNSTGATINLIEVVDNIDYTDAAAAVPEPASLALFGLGFAGLAALRRRQIARGSL